MEERSKMVGIKERSFDCSFLVVENTIEVDSLAKFEEILAGGYRSYTNKGLKKRKLLFLSFLALLLSDENVVTSVFNAMHSQRAQMMRERSRNGQVRGKGVN